MCLHPTILSLAPGPGVSRYLYPVPDGMVRNAAKHILPAVLEDQLDAPFRLFLVSSMVSPCLLAPGISRHVAQKLRGHNT